MAGAGGVVGEGEHFPALRSEAGEAQPFGEADRPQIHGREDSSQRKNSISNGSDSGAKFYCEINMLRDEIPSKRADSP